MALSIMLLLFAAFFAFKGAPTVSAVENKDAEPNKAPSDVNDKPCEEKKTTGQKQPDRPEHTHPAFGERTKERAEMVEWQIHKRGVDEPNVLSSLCTVPRHAFVRSSDLRRAYSDQPLPIGMGQTISQPYIVAYMTEALKLDPNSRVLEIGTGSGYQAAICAEITKEVYTIEIIEELAESAGRRLSELGYKNIWVKAADGYFGWQEKGPFDAIIVTCAAGFVPPPLIEQLKPDGRLVLPLGSPFGSQRLVLITKDDTGRPHSKSLLPVRFVPMLGRIQEP